MIHFTGHPKRLYRFKSNEINTFNETNFSAEELISEIGAAFLNCHTGILKEEKLNDSYSYIQGWINKLRDDKKFIIEASAKDQKAVDYI